MIDDWLDGLGSAPSPGRRSCLEALVVGAVSVTVALVITRRVLR